MASKTYQVIRFLEVVVVLVHAIIVVWIFFYRHFVLSFKMFLLVNQDLSG